MVESRFEKYFDACAQGQSDYALEHLVTGGQLTPYRRFKQAILELFNVVQAIDSQQFALEERQVDLVELTHNLTQDYENPYDKKRDEIKLRRAEYDINAIKKTIASAQRDVELHSRLLKQYEAELGISPDATTEEIDAAIEKAEGDHYVVKLAMDIAANLVQARGGPPQGVTLALQQLPKEDIERVANIFPAMMAQMMENQYTDALHSPEGVQALERLGEKLKMVSNNQPENVRSLK